MRRVLLKAALVLGMGIYSLWSSQQAAAASATSNCPIMACYGVHQDNVEYCMQFCGTPYYSCLIDPYQPYGPSLRHCHVNDA